MHLPEFWQFLRPGWWALHVLSIAIIYPGGIAHGRRKARREAQSTSLSTSTRS